MLTSHARAPARCLDSIQVSVESLSHHVVCRSLLIRHRTVTSLAVSPPLPVTMIINNYDLKLRPSSCRGMISTPLSAEQIIITNRDTLSKMRILPREKQVSTKLPFTDAGHGAAMAHPHSLPLLRLCFHLCVPSGLAPSFHFLPALLRLQQSLQPTFIPAVILCHR